MSLRRPSRAGGLALVLAAALAAACARPAPRAIAYGTDTCRHCHMTVADPRFAAELVTRRGLVYTFDDPGCLAAFVRSGAVPPGAVHSLWVNDYLAPDSLLDVRAAVFLATDTLSTPMGSHLIALRPGARADSLRRRLGGRLLRWGELPAQDHPTGRPGAA